MLTLTTFILRYLYVFLSIIIGIPGIDMRNIFQIKFVLFFGMLIFEFYINSILSRKKKCEKNIRSILNDSFLKSLLAVIGYSFYIDLIEMKYFYDIIDKISESKLLMSSMISSFIVIFMFIADLLFSFFKTKC